MVLRFNRFVNKYRRHGLITLAVLAILTLVAAELFPPIKDFVTQRSVIPFVTLLILLDLAASESRGEKDDNKPTPMKNQDESMPVLAAHVRECRRSSIDLLEYAGATTLPLIREIQRERVPLRLLIKHPATINGLQQQRMITTLDTLYNSIFDDYDGKLEIRCYRAPYSLRARKIGDDMLEIGWLTPDIRREMAYGHSNPSFIVDISRPENHNFLEFFNRSFRELWDADDTEDGREVLKQLQAGTATKV